MQKITDQATLDYLNGKSSIDPTISAPNISALNKITDQKTLDYLNGKSHIDPTAFSSNPVMNTFQNFAASANNPPGSEFPSQFQDFAQGEKYGLEKTGLQAGINMQRLWNFLRGNNSAPSLQNQLNNISNNPNLIAANQAHPYWTEAGSLLGQSSPLIPGGAGSMATIPEAITSLGTQSGIGALTNSDPMQGAALGLGMGAFGSAFGKGFSEIADALQASGLGRKFSNMMQTVMPEVNKTNQDAFDLANANYQKTVQQNDANWKLARANAALADSAPAQKIVYDDSGRINGLKDLQTKYQTKYDNNPSAENKNALDVINQEINNPITNYNQAMDRRIGLNERYGATMQPGVGAPHNAINDAIRVFHDNMQDNILNNNLGDTFGNAWENANNSAKKMYQTFHQVINPNGKVGDSNFLEWAGNFDKNGIPKDPDLHVNRGNFVSQYLPSANENGIGNFQKFSNMIGNQDQATGILKANLFSGLQTPESFLKQFNKLSPQQQSYLFKPEELNQINNIQQSYVKGQKAFAPDIMKNVISNVQQLHSNAQSGSNGINTLLNSLMGYLKNK